MSAARGRDHRWSRLDMAASLAISAFWHLLVLVVLTMAVHPFTLPEQRPISVELLPSLPSLEPPPPPPPVEVQLRPRVAEDAKPEVRLPPPVPPTTAEPKPVTPPPQPQPLDVARPAQTELDNPPAVERRSTAAKPLQSSRPSLQIPETPPAPLDLARPAPPALQTPVDVQRAAPAPKRALDANRAAPALPAPSESEAAPAPSPQVQVLTSEAVVKAPVEIRSRDRTPINPRQTEPALPDIPAGGSGGGAPPAGGGGQGGGAAGGGLRPYGDVTGGFAPGGLKGLRTTLGCASPDTYRLTAEEKEACLKRLAQEAKAAAGLGPNIPASKQAEYDRYTACRRAYHAAGVPSFNSASEGTSINGLGPNPSLKDCGPGDR